MAYLYATDGYGTFIPKYFAMTSFHENIEGVSEEEWNILLAGEEHEHYWDVWDDVLRNAKITSGDKTKTGFLWQDGDLWIIWGEDDPDYKNIVGEEP